MKKLLTIAIVVLVCMTTWAQPVVVPSKIVTAIKIDDKTVEVTTVTTTITETPERSSTTISTVVEKLNRDVVQTKLRHMQDIFDDIQKQLDAANERKAELIEILKVFN